MLCIHATSARDQGTTNKYASPLPLAYDCIQQSFPTHIKLCYGTLGTPLYYKILIEFSKQTRSLHICSHCTASLATMAIILSEYLNIFARYVKQYGENTAVLMQVGSFYEMYGVENNEEKSGNCTRLSEILNIALTRKNKKIIQNNRHNPLMLGFPCLALNKYIQILLDENFTIVIVDQEKTPLSIRRTVTKVVSPSTDIDSHDDNYLALVYTNTIKADMHIGISVISVLTGNSCVHECYSEPNDTNMSLDDTISFIKQYKPREVVFCSAQLDDSVTASYLGLDTDGVMCHRKEANKIASNVSYQNAVLGSVFDNKTMLSNIELLDLEHKPYALISYVLLLEFVYNHSPLLLKKMSMPHIHSPEKSLVLSTNTIDQLNITRPGRSRTNCKNTVFSVINKCSTSVGKRLLQKRLSAPICCAEKLEELYQQVDDFADVFDVNGGVHVVESMLNKILDIEKLQRRMSIGVMYPNELAGLNTSYCTILQLNSLLEGTTSKTICLKNIILDSNVIGTLTSFLNECKETFYLENMHSAGNISTAMFKEGIFPEIDKLHININDEMKKIESIASYVEKICGDVRIESTQNVGYYLTVSNARAKKAMHATNLVFKQNKTSTRVTSHEMDVSSKKIATFSEKLEILTKKVYKKALEYLSSSYCNMFGTLVDFVSQIDVIKSNYKTSSMYNYCRPKIDKSYKKSFFDATNMRHPIIERIDNGVEYVPNDLAIGHGKNGIILYSMNSCGKTSLLKACGISVILAQMGCFVPASSYTFYPFKCIMTRIISEENIMKGQSSFVAEMSELRAILRRANDESTLVLADEITHGTEHTSGSSIFISSVETLADRKVNFMFTTHLHNVYPFVKDIPNVKISHLSVGFEDDKIVFERKLKDGPGGSMYGLEVCEFLGMDSDFLARAFQIRNMITPDKTDATFGIKMSKYNKTKHVQKCEVCGYSPKAMTDMPLDVHHINQQSLTDCNGMIKGIHKNAKSNLVALCKQCHIMVHKDKIKIHGYKNTATGISLNTEKYY